jgi:excisionase family DNA binding protein
MVTYNEIPAVLEQIQKDLRHILNLLSKEGDDHDKKNDLLTRQDVCALLKIRLSTLHNWVKARRLKKYCIGGRVYFRHRDIMDLLKKNAI